MKINKEELDIRYLASAGILAGSLILYFLEINNRELILLCAVSWFIVHTTLKFIK